MSPVDYVSEVIAHIVLQNNWEGPHSFNVVNPSPFSYSKLFEQVRAFGFNLDHVEYQDWRSSLLESLENAGSDSQEMNALFPVAAQFSPNWINNLKNPEYSNKNVELMVKSEVKFPDMDLLIDLYLSYFIKCRFIDPPAHISHKFETQSEKFEKLTRTNRNN
jgi:hypothetical protein